MKFGLLALILTALFFSGAAPASVLQCGQLFSAQANNPLAAQALHSAESNGHYSAHQARVTVIPWMTSLSSTQDTLLQQPELNRSIVRTYGIQMPTGIATYASLDLNLLVRNYAKQIQNTTQLHAVSLVFERANALAIPLSLDTTQASDIGYIVADLTARLHAALSLEPGNVGDFESFRKLIEASAHNAQADTHSFHSSAAEYFNAFARDRSRRSEIADQAAIKFASISIARQTIVANAVETRSAPVLPAPNASLNVFAAKESVSIPIEARQKAALKIMTALIPTAEHTGGAQVAAKKLHELAEVADSEPLARSIRGLNSTLARRQALEFVVLSFRDVARGDGDLRQEAVRALGDFNGADLTTIETLLPLARGSDAITRVDYQEADRAIQQIHGRMGNDAPDLYLTNRADRTSPEIQKLEAAQIESMRSIDEHGSKDVKIHQNAVYIVTLRAKDGGQIRGVFKPALSESVFQSKNPDKIQFTREVQAHDFYHEYFNFKKIDLPGTYEVVIRFGGKSYGVGSFQMFVEGAQTLNKWYLRDNPVETMWDNPRAFNAQKNDRRWSGLEEAVRVFDFSIGNRDRFPVAQALGNPNNIMLTGGESENSDLTVSLIDSGGGRTPRPFESYGPRDLPALNKIPLEVATVMRSFDDAKIKKITAQYTGDLSAGGLDSLTHLLKVEHDYVTVGNPFFRPEARYLQILGLQWHALNIIKSEVAAVPDVRLREIAFEKLQSYAPPPHVETFAHWLSEMTPVDRTRYALEYVLSTFHDVQIDAEFREHVITLLGHAEDDAAARLLAPIADGGQALSSHEESIAKQALAALRAPVVETTTSLVHSFFEVSPARYQTLLSDQRVSTAKQEAFFGIASPRGVKANLNDELQSLQVRVDRLRLRAPRKDLRALITPLMDLRYLAELDSRVSMGSKYLVFDRVKSARDINQQRIFTPEELRTKKLKFVNGRVLDANHQPLDTGDQPYLFVMDGDGNIFAAAEDTTPGQMVKHGSFFGGKPAAAAGEIVVRNGVLIGVKNSSGNYQPPFASIQQVEQEMANYNVHPQESLTETAVSTVGRLAVSH